MADDMEKKGQQGGQPGQGQQSGKPGQYDQPGQPGQGQQSGQPGQQQPKKGGKGQHDNEEDDQNRHRRPRASQVLFDAIFIWESWSALAGSAFYFARTTGLG